MRSDSSRRYGQLFSRTPERIEAAGFGEAFVVDEGDPVGSFRGPFLIVLPKVAGDDDGSLDPVSLQPP